MFRVDSSKPEQILTITYSLRVPEEETQRCMEEMKVALTDMNPGFRLLVDLSGLEHMEPSCAIYIREIMKLCNEKKISAVARVIPDPHKDIGLYLMSHFYYDPTVRIITAETMAEALERL